MKEVKEETVSEDTLDEKIPEEELHGEEAEEEVPEEETASGTLVPSGSLTESDESFVGTIKSVVSGNTTWFLVGGVSLLVVIGIIAISIVLKKRKGSKKSVTINTPGSLPMELKVYSGKVNVGNTTIYLADSLTIGSQKDCDLIIEGKGVEPIHAKIFKQNGQVYIEDLKSKEGVAIGGMLIQEHNPLRSGDVISIGDVDFTLIFR